MTESDWIPPLGWEQRPMCVLGSGVLGRRIAACFLAAGRDVRIRDPSNDALQQAQSYITQNISAFNTLTDSVEGKLDGVQDLTTAVKDCWLVIEAIPEILSLKESTFADLERLAPSDCIFATNSSSYKSGELLSQVQHPSTKSRVLNTHFMMPPEALIVELMTSGYTTKGIFPFLEDRLKEAGLHPVTALKESTGFIFNRIWAAIKREVLAVLAEGVSTPQTIDAIWIEQYASRRVGPCSMMDSVGLDTVEHIEKHYIKDRALPSYHLDWLEKNYLSQGKMGNKTREAGGLYSPPPPGSQTRILLLNIGLAEPLPGRSAEDIAHSGEILSLLADDASARPIRLIGKLPSPDGIDISSSTKRMFWTNMGHPKKNDGSIQSAALDGTDLQYVIPPGSGVFTPKQMVIDQTSQKLYCCDREGLRVVRCNLDGTQFETIFQAGDWEAEPHKQADPTYWPVGIALSPQLNKFFWTQKGHSKAGEGRIFAAGLDSPPDPANRTDIETVASGLPECIDLEFDDHDGILYWTDRGELPFGNTLNAKQIVGKAPPAEGALGRQILAQGLGEGIGLKLDRANDCLYVSDLGGHLWKCRRSGGPKQKLYEAAAGAFTGIAFYKE